MKNACRNSRPDLSPERDVTSMLIIMMASLVGLLFREGNRGYRAPTKTNELYDRGRKKLLLDMTSEGGTHDSEATAAYEAPRQIHKEAKSSALPLWGFRHLLLG